MSVAPVLSNLLYVRKPPQIVGVIDSGLDMASCYLWDPDFPNYANDSSQGTIFASVQVPPLGFANISKAVMFYSADQHRKVCCGRAGPGSHLLATMAGAGACGSV
jgi:hypothetical protein